MQHKHPDDRFALNAEERRQFRELWKELADDGTPRPADDTAEVDGARAGWSFGIIVCVVLIFIGLAANSGVIVVLAAGAAVGAYVAQHRD
ncbi:hypothetical protein [Actinophytocola algeriensis]|uniref:DUF3040 family protein n=1 Tax=Actinophytocola algeriensis TaxID=1768010 RepID=A0A7W7VGA4_9PSEU|nr:hypothetical protein [Actinophytocola algeriensis]MBB4909151.1 hypothetical protein [Actinophytocola algeriensis]MBE1474461.1 hypothetical protein [Actinophytocola algeriensis]